MLRFLVALALCIILGSAASAENPRITLRLEEVTATDAAAALS